MKRKSRDALFAWATFAATVAVCLPVLDNGFVNWDDDWNITGNPHYRGLGPEQLRWMFTTFHMGHYQPLAWLSLGADYSLWGMEPRGYHLTALLLHALCGVAFFFVAKRLLALALGARGIGSNAARDSGASSGADAGNGSTHVSAAAFAASLLFALHPLRVESFAWATERRDLLSALFFLLATLAYIGARAPGATSGAPAQRDDTKDAAATEGRARSLLPALTLFLLALLSKASALAFPFVLLVLDAYPLRRIQIRPRLSVQAAVLREKVPFLALAALFGGVALAAQSENEGLATLESHGLGTRLAIALYGLAYYVRKTVVPTALSPVHLAPSTPDPFAAPYLASGALVALLTALFAWRAARGRPGLLAAWAVYAILLAPVLGVAQVWRQIVSDRYAYLSCAVWALVAAAAPVVLTTPRRASPGASPGDDFGARGSRASRIALWAAVGVAIVLLAAASRSEIRHWRDSESLWRHALAVDPENNIAHNNLGVFLRSSGRAGEGEKHLREAIRIDPTHAEARFNLGNALFEGERFEEAVAQYREAIRSQPGRAAYHMNLGNALARLGRYEEAVAEQRAALALEPGRAEAHWNLALALRALGRSDEALEEERAATRLAPVSGEQRLARAAERYAAGDFEGAIIEYDEALRARPDIAEAHYGRGVCLLRLGRFADAEAASRAALAARPDYTDARVNLGVSLASLGRLAEAEAVYREALASSPAHPAARINLAGLLASTGRFAEASQAAADGIAPARARGDSALAATFEERARLYAAGQTAPGG